VCDEFAEYQQALGKSGGGVEQRDEANSEYVSSPDDERVSGKLWWRYGDGANGSRYSQWSSVEKTAKRGDAKGKAYVNASTDGWYFHSCPASRPRGSSAIKELWPND